MSTLVTGKFTGGNYLVLGMPGATASITAVNFAILHLFGYQFAPRYRDIYDTVRTSLYGFKHPSQYDDDRLLKPVRKRARNGVGR